MRLFRFCLAAMLLVRPVWADVPGVVVDIAPVHSLVAQVMGDVGAPQLLVAPRSSPHSYALRPSQAHGLQNADLVIWIGPELTPWLSQPMANLAGGADQIALADHPATRTLELRGNHDHEEDQHGHGGDIDPHVWLDPENASAWLPVIAEMLAGIDPANAAIYRANADAAQDRLTEVTAELARTLEPVKNRPFITLHDAFQYFEARFGLVSAGALTLGDAGGASPARVALLQDTVAGQGIHCAFREPQFDDRLLLAVAGDTLQIGTLDPIGSTLQPGPDLYTGLLRDMAQSLASCPGN